MEGTEARGNKEEEGEPREQENGQAGGTAAAGFADRAAGQPRPSAQPAAACAKLRRGGAGPHALPAPE